MNALRLWTASALSVLCIALCLVAPVRAQNIITFDDVTIFDFDDVLDGYQGLGWYNFSVLNGPVAENFYFGPNGYSNGVVSPDYVAYNGFGEPAAIYSLTGDTFTFNSFYVNAAWRTDLLLEIYGFDSNYNISHYAYGYIDPFGPYYGQLDWQGVTEVLFISSGGDYAGFAGDGTHFALDNVVVTVPEPSAYATFGILAAGLCLGLVRARRRKR